MDKMFFNCEKTVSLTFEDVDLSFADMGTGVHLSPIYTWRYLYFYD